jgi:hypothetical protein
VLNIDNWHPKKRHFSLARAFRRARTKNVQQPYLCENPRNHVKRAIFSQTNLGQDLEQFQVKVLD